MAAGDVKFEPALNHSRNTALSVELAVAPAAAAGTDSTVNSGPLSATVHHDDANGAAGASSRMCASPLSIHVNDLSLAYELPAPGGVCSKAAKPQKLVLQHINAHVRPGQLLALMGGSGCGKTTLLNVLAARQYGGTTTGSVVYTHRSSNDNGHGSHTHSPSDVISDQSVIKALSGYVLQTDHLLPNLSVRETLQFAAALRLPGTMTPAEKNARVEEVILELGLKECANTLIGGDLIRGVSGGEKRRVSVAVQMLTDPSVLFLDEPTTGLDAFSALNLVEALVKLARQNRAIIVSIHQPRSDIFRLFDSVLLLSKGQPIYFGWRRRMVRYFESPPLQLVCPLMTNPADFVVDVSSVDPRDDTTEAESRARVAKLVECFVAREKQRHERRRQQHEIFTQSATAPTSTGAAVLLESSSSDDEPGADADDDSDEKGGSSTAAAAKRMQLIRRAIESAVADGSAAADPLDELARRNSDTARRSGNAVVIHVPNTIEPVPASLMMPPLSGLRTADVNQSVPAAVAVAVVPSAKAAKSNGAPVHTAPSIHGVRPTRDDLASKRAGFFEQTRVLTGRAFRNLFADRVVLVALAVECAFMSLVLGFIYFQPDITGEKEGSIAGIKTKFSVCYTYSALQPYLILIFSIYRFCQQLQIFDAEREDGMYDTAPFLLSESLSFIPLNIFFPVVFSVVVYLFAGMRLDEPRPLLVVLAQSVIIQYCATGFALACASISRSFPLASLIGNSLTTFFTLSTGFFLNGDDIPVYLSWLRPISYPYYSLRLLAINEFADHSYPCPYANDPAGAMLTEPALASNATTPEAAIAAACALFDGNAILAGQGFNDHGMWVPAVCLIAILVVFHIISYCLLRFMPQHPTASNASASVVTESAKAAKPTAAAPAAAGDAQNIVVAPAEQHQRVTVRVEHLSLTLHPKSGEQPASSSAVVDPIGTKRRILNDVDTTFEAGKLVVIMGGSGSGKTSLLSLLAKRGLSAEFAATNGRILFNESVLDARTWQSVVGYVMQADHLLPSLTVRETLEYAALLRLPESMSRADKFARVTAVIDELGLRDCANTLVGGATVRGVSGGEKRRVTIGIQLLTDPIVLVLDEPTSGLDAFTAHHITVTLKRIAERGRTVICSMHQPRSDVYQLFDSIVLLSRGQVVFSGAAAAALSYFSGLLSEADACPPRTNVADWLLDVSSVDVRDPVAEARTSARVARLMDHFAAAKTDQSKALAAPAAVEPIRVHLLRSEVSFLTALPVLISRSWTNFTRQDLLVSARVMQMTSFAVILLLYFVQSIGSDQHSIQNRLGIIQEFTALLFIGMLNSIAVFPDERNVYYRERADGTYDTLPFFLSYLVAEVPFEIFSSIIFTLITVVSVGFRFSGENLAIYSWLFFCVVNAGESVGIAFCGLVYNPGISVSLTNVVMSNFTLMAGVLSPAMPLVMQYINRISVLRYIERVLAVREFSGATFYCRPDELLSGGTVCPFTTGEAVLDVYGFSSSSVGEDIAIVTGLMVAYRVIAYLILHAGAKRRTYQQ